MSIVLNTGYSHSLPEEPAVTPIISSFPIAVPGFESCLTRFKGQGPRAIRFPGLEVPVVAIGRDTYAPSARLTVYEPALHSITHGCEAIISGLHAAFVACMVASCRYH
jgi:hypothetical protein